MSEQNEKTTNHNYIPRFEKIPRTTEEIEEFRQGRWELISEHMDKFRCLRAVYLMVIVMDTENEEHIQHANRAATVAATVFFEKCKRMNIPSKFGTVFVHNTDEFVYSATGLYPDVKNIYYNLEELLGKHEDNIVSSDYLGLCPNLLKATTAYSSAGRVNATKMMDGPAPDLKE